MRPSRGMGAVAPSKMPSGVRKARRDDTDFTEFAKGGKVSSASNRADGCVAKGKTRGKMI